MPIEDKFPALTDAELSTLLDNVTRLSVSGTDRQRIEADRLHPLIVAEQETRRANAPPPKTKAKAPVKAPARKKSVKAKPALSNTTP
jgi:hypothetical protein